MAPFSNLAGGLGSRVWPRCRGARGGPDLVGGKQVRGATELALAAANAFDRFVALAKMRWRIERDYQELKQEARARALGGTRLARLSSPCHPLHRRLRLPGRRTGEDSPLITDTSLRAFCSRRFGPETARRPPHGGPRTIACLAILRSECLLLNVQVIVDRLARLQLICSNHLLDGELLKQDRQRLAS